MAAALGVAACGNSEAPQIVDGRTGSLLDQPPVDIAAAEGAGIFGRWTVDEFGLPAYDYTLDQVGDPRGARTDLDGRRDAWHQLGNDAIIANAYNDGYVQLWSQQRMYQWVNQYAPEQQHYAGGYGYLHVDGETLSTLWLDRPAGSDPQRRFGLGYMARELEAQGVEIREAVTTPFGDLPVLVHEVKLTNLQSTPRTASWWEYWDVNPRIQLAVPISRGLDAPHYDEAQQLLSVRQSGDVADLAPLTIFLAAVDAPVEGFETDLREFFGSGDRARPEAVTQDAAANSIAPGAITALGGQTLFALRSPVTLAPRQTVTLRYVYGMAQDARIDDIVAQVRADADTQAASARAWRDWVPQVDFGSARRWLSRELQWDAYMVRSSSVYEEACGHHVITQGGYYQYGLGMQIAYRDPLQHMLPIIYSEPELARDVLRYSMQQQPPLLGQISYGMGPLCTRIDGLGTANDLDFWLLLSAVEYVQGTRDFAFLDEEIGFRGGLPTPALTGGSVWEHLKLAYFHQEAVTLRGPNGHYVVGTGGDWSDLSPVFLQMTESALVTAQLAYIYPRLADVAELYGDHAFALQVRARADELLAKQRSEWTGRGWYARGYSLLRRIGEGAIFGEPQPWAILAGAPDSAQAATLVANIRRFLTGIDAPPEVKGPALIGSSMSPSVDDPEVTETSFPMISGGNNAVFVGGAWYAVNGWLTWALGQLDGIVPDAAEFALDELERNTLKAHAEAWPEQWNGILNVDDMCNAHFADDPSLCGIGIFVSLLNINGQVAHQPAWSLFAALKLAGVEPIKTGYRIAPRLPLEKWSLRFPSIGVAQDAARLSGYLRLEGAGPLELQVKPRSVTAGALKATVNGQPVDAVSLADGSLSIKLDAHAGELLDWAVEPLGGE
jgi:hypothetical protein